jgi:N-acetylmuramoyl-L-alanine amidase
MSVVLDPGHGGYDFGARFGNFVEKNMNLQVCLEAAVILRKKGIRVDLTRNADRFVSLEDRAIFCNKVAPKIFVSVHHNAANGKGSGFEIYHYTGSAPGFALAKAIGDEFIKSMNKRYIGSGMMMGTVPGNYYVIRATKCTAALTEYGFIDNPKDTDRMNMKTQAQELARGICRFLGVKVELTIEDIVDSMLQEGYITDRAHWVSVLNGERAAKPEYLRIIFEKLV